MNRRGRLMARARDGYRRAFASEPGRFFAAPGRVNLIGEHVDYNDGLVLPCAIDRETIVALGSPAPEDEAGDPLIEAIALDMSDARARISLAAPIERAQAGWENLVRGVACALQRRGRAIGPVRLAVAGDVPIGAGLSSSAAMAVAITLALAAQGGPDLSPREIALIAREAEADFLGVPCGIMDQMASAASAPGAALLLDCRTLEHRPVPISDQLALVIIDSGIRRQLVSSAFAERRRECEAAARHYGVAALRDLTPERLQADRAGLDPVLFARARHVVSEIARVEPMARALERGDSAAIAALMSAGHASLRDDFAVSLDPLDRLAECIAGVLGTGEHARGGVRLTGAGFGGCLVALCEREAAGEAIAAIETHYNPAADIPASGATYSASAGAHEVLEIA